jgi:hypothetical protein
MKRYVLMALIPFATVLCFAINAPAGEVSPVSKVSEVTLVGEVNDNFQLYANHQLYEVAVTPIGDDLVKNYISAKVEVVGTVEEKQDTKIITVRSFRILPE